MKAKEENKSCTNCIFFHEGMREQSSIAKLMKAIGECDNKKVKTRICVSYGMICNGDHHQSKTTHDN